jgi:hypothetical protein
MAMARTLENFEMALEHKLLRMTLVTLFRDVA